jgi:hypothetical protein
MPSMPPEFSPFGFGRSARMLLALILLGSSCNAADRLNVILTLTDDQASANTP